VRGEGGVAGVGDGSRIGATASTVVAREKLFTPEPKMKEEAPVGAETKASASSALTSTRGEPERRDTDGGNSMGGAPGLISTTVEVGDGTLGMMPSVSGAAALDAPPNSKTEVGDWPRAPRPMMEVVEASSVGDAAGPYSCKGQITHPCIEHQNGGGGATIAGSMPSSASSNEAAG
jgi:hypothetical protein